MNDLDMSSSDSSIAEIEEKTAKKQMANLADFLGKEELQNLEPELKLADELMSKFKGFFKKWKNKQTNFSGKLTTKSDGSVQKKVEKKKGRKTKEKPVGKVRKTIDKKTKKQKAAAEKGGFLVRFKRLNSLQTRKRKSRRLGKREKKRRKAEKRVKFTGKKFKKY